MTRVLHVPYTFAPDPAGGTEHHVEALSHALRASGWDARIAAPGPADRRYVHGGLVVRRFAVAPRLSLEHLYGQGDPVATTNFAAVLDEEAPDLVHVHALSPAVSLDTVRTTRRRGLPVVFSYHTPAVSCQRETLLEWGERDCDGVLDARRCAQCSLHGLGVPRVAAAALARVPDFVGAGLGRLRLAGGLWTALRTPHLLQRRRKAFRELMAEVDHVIVPARWARDLLLGNGVAAGKVTLVAHGLAAPPASHAGARTADSAQPLRVAYLGRLTPAKGAHLLAEAITASPTLHVQADFYGITQGARDEAYAATLRRAAANDPRLRFRAPVDAAAVVRQIGDYDLVAVPSCTAETGPLVVLEAFAAGVPVLGANVPGIRDRVRHGADGVLVDRAVPAWTEALRALADDRDRVARLRANVQPPRTMERVAQEVVTVYERVLPLRRASSSPSSRSAQSPP